MSILLPSDPDPVPEDEAHALAASAVALARSGRADLARRQLERALEGRNAEKLPVAFHFRLLRASAENGLADWFRDAACAKGFDLTAALPDKARHLTRLTPSAAETECRRYEAELAAGRVNPTMIGRYAIALSRAGRSDDVAALHSPMDLFQARQLDGMAGFASLDAFNRQLVEEMRQGTYLSYYNARRFMYDVQRMQDVHRLDSPAVTALKSEVKASLDRHAERLADLPASHPVSRMRPGQPAWRLWSNIYGPGAYVSPHLHGQAWLVAIYYPEVPEIDAASARDAGALHIGCPIALGGIAGAGWPNHVVQPRGGTLLIMPSYFYHWSAPYHGTGQRIAVTIDWCWP